jgi:hypothetical protein
VSTLNWKDYEDRKNAGCVSEARAAREVRGRYRILRWEGGETWYGEITPTTYEVEFRRSNSSAWNDIFHPRGTPGTLAEAKRMAEEDHEWRRQALAVAEADNAKPEGAS